MNNDFPSKRVGILFMLLTAFMFGGLIGYGFGKGGAQENIGAALYLFFNPENLITGLIVVTITMFILRFVYRKEIEQWKEEEKKEKAGWPGLDESTRGSS